MGKFTQIIEFHKSVTFHAKISKIFGSKYGIYMENSSSKLNFRQIHLVYLPKRSPISKPGLDIGQLIYVFGTWYLGLGKRRVIYNIIQWVFFEDFFGDSADWLAEILS